jgi:hypothetical protein
MLASSAPSGPSAIDGHCASAIDSYWISACRVEIAKLMRMTRSHITKRDLSLVIRKFRISSNANRSISRMISSFDPWLDASS